MPYKKAMFKRYHFAIFKDIFVFVRAARAIFQLYLAAVTITDDRAYA
jgi:hypothetical protein